MKTKKYSLVVLSVFLILLVFIASASAADSNETDVLAVDGSTNTVDEKLALDYSSEVSAVANDSKVIENDGNNLLSADNGDEGNILKTNTADDQILTASGKTWYVNASAASGGTGSEAKPFNNVESALDKAGNGDTIMVAAGTYTGDNNKVTIDSMYITNLDIIKYGDGEAIFDGEGSDSPFFKLYLMDNDMSININGLTFKNSAGYAIRVQGSVHKLKNFTINANFINIGYNNYGGPIKVQNVENVEITGTFINNTGAMTLIEMEKVNNLRIHDSIFINNSNKIFEFMGDSYQISDNWFGNTADNYMTEPLSGLNNWLFLNATADSSELEVGESSKITFKLYSYDGRSIGNYTGPIDIKLNLTQTLGELDKDAASLGEEITYTAKQPGDASVTATFETASYTIALTNTRGPTTWYVNSSKTSSGNGTSDAEAFMTLKEALDNSINGDTIMIASGEYKGTGNIGLVIERNLNFIKYGDGEAIFDAESLNRIWTVSATSINITGLTFKNGKVTGYGGGICFISTLTNSNINATFINNTALGQGGGAIYISGEMSNSNITSVFANNSAKRGGAIYNNVKISNSNLNSAFINNTVDVDGGAVACNELTNVNITGDFINNTAKGSGGKCGGGAYAFYGKLNNVFISANFIGNSATGSASTDGGAAIYFFMDINNVDITGIFINNTGNNVIKISNSVGYANNIHDSIFVNNNVSDSIIAASASGTPIKANFNWFGNNATNYSSKPNIGLDVTFWLFLNATAEPGEIKVGESSNVTFKWYAYGFGSPSEYTNSKINIDLALSQTLGELNQTTTSIGEGVLYTAKQTGDASVTATFETVSMTITLTNADPRTPTEINVTNSTLDLKVYDEIATGATLTPADAGNLTYTSSNSSVAIVENGKIKALKEGNATITVSFAGDDQYRPAVNKTIDVTVTLRDANWTFINMITGKEEELDGAFLYLPWNYIPDCYVKDADGVGLPAGTNITIFCKDDGNFIIGTITIINTTVQENGLFNVDVSNVKPDKTYSVSFSAEGYTTATATIRVVKAPTVIDVTNSTVDLKVNDEIATGATLTPADAGNLTYTSSNSTVAIVENGKIKALREGNATITVSFAGNEQYAPAENKTIEVTVKKRELNLNATTFEIIGNMTLIVTGFENATGNVTITAGGYNNSTAIMMGMVIVSLPKFDENVTAYIYYPGDDKYYNASTTVDIIAKKDLNLTVIADPIYVGQNATVIVNGFENATGNATMIAGMSIYNATIINGTATVTVPGLKNTTTVIVFYMGDNNYSMAFAMANLTVLAKENLTISASADSIFVGENATVIITGLENATGEVSVRAGNGIYFGPIVNGIAKVNIPSMMQNVTADVSYEGDVRYNPANTTAIITVNKIPTKINLTVQGYIVCVDETRDNLAVLQDEAGNNITDEYTLNYASSNESVVKIVNGSFIAVSEGIASVTVSFNGTDKYEAAKDAEIKVGVLKRPTKIIIANSTLNVKAYIITPTGATLDPAEAGDLTYTSSNESVAKVIMGEIWPIAKGQAIITVSFDGDDKYAAAESKNITVNVTPQDSSVTVENATLDLKVDDSYAINATTVPEILQDNITYTSSDESVVTVDKKGTVTAIGEGNAIITIDVGDDIAFTKNSTQVFVTVSKAESSIDIEPKSLEVVAGEDAVITVILPADATGIVLVDVGDNKYYGDVEKGNATVNIAGLTAGDYTAEITYLGDDKYTNASGSASIKVDEVPEPVDPKVNITVSDVKAGETAKAIVDLPSDATGNVVVRVDGKEAAALIVYGGTVEMSLGELTAGNHTVVAVYSGNNKYGVGVASKDVTVEKLTTNISADSVEIVEGEVASVIVTVDENATGRILVEVDGNKYYADIAAGKATVDVVGLTAGDYTAEITYSGDDKYGETTTTAAVKVDAKPAPKSESSIAIVEVSGYNITGILNDGNGKGIADAEIKYSVSGIEKTVVTAKDGSFVIEVQPNVPVIISYAGDNSTEPVESTITVQEPVAPVPVKMESRFNITNNAITIYGYAVDVNAGEEGIYYATSLLDVNGKPISNVYIEFAVNNKIYNRTTYENGSFKPYRLNMVRAGRYTMAFNFAGDDNYTNAFACVCVDLDKKPITIKASAKSYKAATKTKKYTVQLKTIVGSSHDGKAHLRSGLVVKLKVNGKTYSGKINGKGKVTFKITNLKKKGKYVAKISYAGDKTYESATKSVKLTIK